MDFQVAHLLVAVGSAIAGAVGGLVGGTWRMRGEFETIRQEFHKDLKATEKSMEEKVETLADRFGETLTGLRQKINDVELNTEREFVSKDGLDDFRREYREDRKADRELIHALMDKVDRIKAI